jgi:hypothetical protein
LQCSVLWQTMATSAAAYTITSRQTADHGRFVSARLATAPALSRL